MKEISKVKKENLRLLKANVSLLEENRQLRMALRQQLINDPTYIHKLQQIREGAL